MKYDVDVMRVVAEMLESCGISDRDLAKEIAKVVHAMYQREEMSIETY